MAGDCAHTNTSCCPSRSWSDEGSGEMMESAGISTGRGPAAPPPHFELIDGLLYRRKLEKGFINYREVLQEDRRLEALSTFHRRRRPGQGHLSLEETYKCVAENYWWEGMYFHIRDFVLNCSECQRTKKMEASGGRGCVSKTMASHGADVLSKLRSQREAGLFCDITLRTDGRHYRAHRAVLAAVSDHFQELFTDMDSNMKTDIDLTGFSEDSLLSLLDFSYSSTLRVRQEDLPEVIAMARHLGMWPAVEACSALMKEQERRCTSSACAGACRERHRQQREGLKRRRGAGPEDDTNDGFSLTLEASDESYDGSPRRNLRRTPRPQNGLPLSPSHRMKLMDFKSPSSKKATTPRHAMSPPRAQSYSPVSPSNTRLLRSTPGAAKEVQRLFPMPETPRRSRKPHAAAAARLSRPPRRRAGAACSPVRVKQEPQEVGEDEEDYARAQEKYKLMTVLGLQRTALLPRPEDLIGWRQKKRLRKLKANNYSLTKRRKPRPAPPPLPFGGVALSLPLCAPVNARRLKAEPAGPAIAEATAPKRPRGVLRRVPPSDRSMRSKGSVPDMFLPAFRGRDLRRSVRTGDAHLPPQQPPRRKTNRTLVRNAVRIKPEPAEFSISGLPLPSDGRRGNTRHKAPPPQRTQPRSAVAMETTVRTLRYNSGRPPTKTRMRRGGSSREGDKTKAGAPGPRGAADAADARPKVSEAAGLQFSEQAPPPSIYSHPLYKVIKEEPADPIPVAPFSDPPSPDLGKRQSKPPIKLLDSGFLFSFCRPAGGAMGALKKEEESVDICLTRSVSQVGDKFGAEESPHRALRARGPPSLPVVKREREERSVTQRGGRRARPTSRNNTQLGRTTGAKAKRSGPKVKTGSVLQQQGRPPPSSRGHVMVDAVRRARLKQLRGPRSQAPKVPKAAHACLQCPASYKDCDALMMHRLRHVEGKHWPCPLCSKTFFRLRNVRNHIRSHDPKLYKCRSCIVAGS